MSKRTETRGERARRQIVYVQNLARELAIIDELHAAIGPDATVTIGGGGQRAKADLSDYPKLRDALRGWLEGRADDIAGEMAENVSESFGKDTSDA